MTTAASAGAAPDSFADLLEAIAERRDRQAFIRLYEHFGPRVKAYLVRLGSTSAEAEELVQEAFFAIWQKARTFDRRQSAVSTWIFTVARNKRIDAVRRTRRPALDPDDPSLVPPPPAQADDILSAAQGAARIREAVARLPAELRDLLILAFFDDRSHSDIAAQTGLPLGTVKSRIRIAMQRLRLLVEEG